MIFDLKTGKRRRVVQIVFGFLAFIFFISFVGFGIGSEVSGGIFDALGIGGGDSGGSTQYESQIEDAEEKLATDPQDETVLADLVRYHFLSATESGVTTDPATGAAQITEGSRADLESAAEFWQRYLDAKPSEPDLGAAVNATQAFVYLEDVDGAISAQKIVATAQDSPSSYYQLALYYYIDNKFEKGDAAGDKAVAAADASERKQIEKNLADLRKQAVKQQEAIKQQQQQQQQGDGDAGSAQLEDPFGSLGGAAAPGTPAPVAP